MWKKMYDLKQIRKMKDSAQGQESINERPELSVSSNKLIRRIT